jgi:hypothetical protein
MIPALERKAEVVKLARLLDTTPDELATLEAVEADTLRELRERVTELLFDGHMGAFRRAVHASGLLPVGLSATIAQHAFGPMLCARLAGLVPVERAISVSERLSPEFLTDVAVHMDPRRASDVISRLPGDLVCDVATRLAGRDEHVVMGRFAGHLSDATLRRVFDVLDDSDLLQIAFTLEDGLERAAELMPDSRMDSVLRCAAAEDLWVEAITLIDDLAEERRAALTRMVAGDPELRASLLAAADREGLGDDARARLAAYPPESG